MKYISTSEAAKKWGLSRRRVAILCKEDHIKSGKYIKKCEEHQNA